MNGRRGTRRGGARHDLALRWLDHQIAGPDDQLLGNVDDLELVRDGDDWIVTGLMVGPAALSHRLPGRLGEWVYAVWRRLHPAERPEPVVIPVEHVVGIDSVVHVDAPAAQALAGSFGLELWLREHVVSRLPGATGPRHEGGGGGAEGRSRLERHSTPEPRRGPLEPARGPMDGARPLSSVLGRTVRDAGGARVGRVSDLVCSGRPRDQRQAPLRVAKLLLTPHLTASRLGYSIDRHQGPAAVRSVVRLWQRRDRVVDVDAVAGLEGLDVERTELGLGESVETRHPHEMDLRELDA